MQALPSAWMQVRSQAAMRGLAIVMGVCALALAAPSAGLAARLVGGRTEQSLARAFSSQRSHRGQAIVSIRTSSVNGTWAVVRSVTPQAADQTRSGATPALRSTYYHLARGQARPKPPPRAVRADLARDFRVEVVYAGSGQESIAYQQNDQSVCAGAGFFTDQETDTVSPMTWSVRYVVDLDDVLSALRGRGGTTLVPNVTFDAAGSRVSATETINRSVQDVGCNGRATTFACTMTFAAGGPDPGGQLSFPAGSGLEAGVPVAARPRGACNPDNFTLGPSLWDGGAVTALVGQLPLLGGTLPARPYAPVNVAWPAGSAEQAQNFAASPCQGDGAVCTDTFAWHGTVSLQPVPGF
jgi:hypothetical protein